MWVRPPLPVPRRSKVRFAPAFFYSCGIKERHPPAPLLLLSNRDSLRWIRGWFLARAKKITHRMCPRFRFLEQSPLCSGVLLFLRGDGFRCPVHFISYRVLNTLQRLAKTSFSSYILSFFEKRLRFAPLRAYNDRSNWDFYVFACRFGDLRTQRKKENSPCRKRDGPFCCSRQRARPSC